MNEQTITKRTESIITEYLSFTGKDKATLTFVDFLAAREMAEKETASGFFAGDKTQTIEIPIVRCEEVEEVALSLPQPKIIKREDEVESTDQKKIKNDFQEIVLNNERTSENNLSNFEILRGLKDEWN